MSKTDETQAAYKESKQGKSKAAGQAMAVGEAMMDETDVKRILSHDFSAHAGAFHDQLLARCLDELGQGKDAEIIQLADSDLEMLAAAGSLVMLEDPPDWAKTPRPSR